VPERSLPLEQALRELGREVVFPPTPELALVVGDRLRRERQPAPRLAFRRRTLVIALAALALAVAAAFAIPPARSAILDFFGLRGVTIERVEERPVFDPATGRSLGVPVTLAEAARAAAFTPLVPREDDVRVTLDRRIPGGAVSFTWNARRLVLTEFRGETTPFVEKSAGPGTAIEFVPVGGRPGFWLTGERHRVVFRDARGRILESRAAGNVLLWERGELTLRLEGARTKAEALAIAGTLRPAPV
jgi:hypothetical protein